MTGCSNTGPWSSSNLSCLFSFVAVRITSGILDFTFALLTFLAQNLEPRHLASSNEALFTLTFKQPKYTHSRHSTTTHRLMNLEVIALTPCRKVPSHPPLLTCTSTACSNSPFPHVSTSPRCDAQTHIIAHPMSVYSPWKEEARSEKPHG